MKITSDHGEQFMEHGGVLHADLYQELPHVPLIIAGGRFPGGLRIQTPVSLIDLAPTALDILGLPALRQFQGQSLVPIVNSGEPARQILSEKAGKKNGFVGARIQADRIYQPTTRALRFLPRCERAERPHFGRSRRARPGPPAGRYDRYELRVRAGAT